MLMQANAIQVPLKITRTWAMPSKNTFDIPQVGSFVKKYLRESKVSIDPFARNKLWATYTNDLDPKTLAEHHMDSADFLKELKARVVQADLVIFDPPYSPERMKRSYGGIGLKMKQNDAFRTGGWKAEKDIIVQILKLHGVVLSFGWNSNGMGIRRGFDIIEILLVCHGACHNDTICMAEKKVQHQMVLI